MAGQREVRARGGQPDARAALERYQLHGIRETGEELGRGSYATVIEVDFKGMRCAAKKIHSTLSQRGEGDRLVGRFEEECRLLGTLRHPHIVQFLGIYFDPATDLPVLVMEFLPAALAQCVERYGRLPAEISYAILRDVALGLCYLHEQRPPVIHRDLSANQVLLTGDMTAKISDFGVAKILQAEEMSCMTQTPGTQSYMPPEALCPNPCYDVKLDVFAFGVMLVHVLSGQWPFPSEPTRVDPHNLARVIGVSEVERRAQYLNIIGHPSEKQEGHPLMPLIERCLNNSPDLRPTSSELVERMSDAVTQQPLTFSNRVDMMQRMESILTEKETLQTRVSVLEGQVERGEVAQREQREESQRQEAALAAEVEQLRLQVGNLEAEKTHLSTTATAREELHCTEMQEKLRQIQGLDANERQHQAEAAAKYQQHETELKEKDDQLQAKLDDQLQAKSTELSSQSSLLSQQRSTIEGLHLQLQQARQCLASGTQLQLERMEQRLERKVVMAKETRKLERLQYQKMLQREKSISHNLELQMHFSDGGIQAQSLSMTAPMFEAIAEKTVQVTNEEQHIVWEGYGLRVHIPPNSVPEGRSCFQLKIAVALSGYFKLPEDGNLVSAVYAFSHDLGDSVLRHAVTVEMQHCANTDASNGLCIVRADEKSDTLYNFKVIPESEFRSDGYGAVKMHSFCRIATFLWWRLLSFIYTLEYCAKIFYTNIVPGGFEFHVYIIPNLDVILKDIEVELQRRDCNCEHGPFTAIVLEEEEDTISLEIPEDVDVCGWKMHSLKSLEVFTKDIVSLAFGKTLIPFQVSVRWNGDEGKAQKQLTQEVKLTGVKEPSNFLTVVSPSHCTASALAVSSPQTFSLPYLQPASPSAASRPTFIPPPHLPWQPTPPEYDAVLKLYGEITELMRATPSMTQHISTQFKTNSWISITTKCSEDELITCALEKIKQDPSKNFKLFVDMLKDTVGMRDIVNKLTK